MGAQVDLRVRGAGQGDSGGEVEGGHCGVVGWVNPHYSRMGEVGGVVDAWVLRVCACKCV